MSFLPGEKIVCVSGDPARSLMKGQVYTVKDVLNDKSDKAHSTITLVELQGWGWFFNSRFTAYTLSDGSAPTHAAVSAPIYELVKTQAPCDEGGTEWRTAVAGLSRYGVTSPSYPPTAPQQTETKAAKNDQDKVDLSLIPYISSLEHARAFMVGEKKYGRYNYCKGHQASQLVAAAERHLKAWFQGEEHDPKDGQHHLGSVMACCSMILRQQELGTLIDNRFGKEAANASDKK
jgi:hypothetical protein